MSYAASRRVAVGVVGTSVLLIGVAMIALPGPALVVIPAGLGILALEFAWARRWLAGQLKGNNGWVAAIHPGSGGAPKCWPPGRFA